MGAGQPICLVLRQLENENPWLIAAKKALGPRHRDWELYWKARVVESF